MLTPCSHLSFSHFSHTSGPFHQPWCCSLCDATQPFTLPPCSPNVAGEICFHATQIRVHGLQWHSKFRMNLKTNILHIKVLEGLLQTLNYNVTIPISTVPTNDTPTALMHITAHDWHNNTDWNTARYCSHFWLYATNWSYLYVWFLWIKLNPHADKMWPAWTVTYRHCSPCHINTTCAGTCHTCLPHSKHVQKQNPAL
jgi:hypothetical protein